MRNVNRNQPLSPVEWEPNLLPRSIASRLAREGHAQRWAAVMAQWDERRANKQEPLWG